MLSPDKFLFLGIFSDDGLTWLYTKRFALRELRDLGFGRRSETYEAILEEEAKDFLDAIRNDCATGKSTLIPEIFFPPLLNCIFYILTGNRVPPSDHKKLRVSSRIIIIVSEKCLFDFI